MAENTYGISLFPQHQRLLRDSAISVEVATARGYVSADTKVRLKGVGIAKAGQSVPGLLIPIWGVDGTIRIHQYRPDTPRLNGGGKALKYETPVGSTLVLDVPPTIREHLGNPLTDLWITEGSRKADAAVSAGLCCIALLGVYGWRGTNGSGGKTVLPDWESVALNGRNVFVAFDSDVMTKDTVRTAMDRLAAFLKSRGATVRLVYLPDGPNGTKVGLDDYLAAGHSTIELQALAREPGQRTIDDQLSETPRNIVLPGPAPATLEDALKVYRRWLYIDDDAPVLLVAATVAANNAEGDPLWTLLVGPPSSGKTEALQGIAALPYVHSAATVTESSLLSGVSNRDRDKDATGGLLRQMGRYGIILCKDFTSVLSQNKDKAAEALAALREVYDGSWDRPTGAGGGRVLHWRGKCGLIGGVTGSIDRFGQVVGALGDRFLLLRLPDVSPEEMAAAALAQGSSQKKMRAELAEAMTGLIAGADLAALERQLHPDEAARLVRLSTFTARARTVVERDFAGQVQVLPQPEGTARIVGQLRRLLGGLEAIGADAPTAWDVLARVALDCVPRMRARVMLALAKASGRLSTGDVAKVLGVDWKTAFRHLSDLRLLDMASMGIEENGDATGTKPRYEWAPRAWLRDHLSMLDKKYPPSSSDESIGNGDPAENVDVGGQLQLDDSYYPMGVTSGPTLTPAAAGAATTPQWVLDAWDREA